MSELSTQSYRLRSWADQLSEHEGDLGVVVRVLVADLREAADTIESLRDRLQLEPSSNLFEPSRWHELFGTPERAARTLGKLDEMSCKYCLLHDYCGDSCLMYRKDNALLAWLKGESQ